MKYRILLLAGICTFLLSQYGCSNEIEVIGVWKDIPVVYGVIKRQDSINYIRVERAFLPPNQSALDVAKNPDSLYFDTTDVKVTMHYINGAGDTLLWPHGFERVRLADEGLTREEGIFANDPAYVYKLTKTSSSSDLLLKIDNRKTGNVFYARTEVVTTLDAFGDEDFSIIMTPSYSLVPYKPIEWRTLDEDGEEVYDTMEVQMTSNSGKIGFASTYDYVFRFYYKEYEVDANDNVIAGSEVDKTLEWKVVRGSEPRNAAQLKKQVSGEIFYRFLEVSLSDVTGTNLRRCPGYLELYIDGASESLRKYQEGRRANEGFIAGLFPADPYSNVSGGYGVLATADRLERPDRPTDPRLMEMSQLTRKHLRERTFTVKNIGFVSENPCY